MNDVKTSEGALDELSGGRVDQLEIDGFLDDK